MTILLQAINQDCEVLKILEEGVLSSASWLNNILFIGGGVLLTINLYRAFKHKTIEVNGLKLPLNKSWIVILAYTIAHLYCSIIFVEALNDYISEDKKFASVDQQGKDERHLWDKLTYSGNFVFRRMEKRVLKGRLKIPLIDYRISIYGMSYKDITSWIYFGLFLLILNGVTDFSQRNARHFWISLTLAFFLALSNWVIGSTWTSNMSDLLNN